LKNADEKSIKITKLSKQYKNKIITVILWICLGFLILRGAGTIVRGNSINLKPFKDKITQNIDKKTTKENKGVAFAENFATEYFNYTGDDKDYYERLSKYSTLDFSRSKLNNMDVNYVNRVDTKWQGDNNLIVDLKVKVTEIKIKSFLAKFITPTVPGTTPSNSPEPTVEPDENKQLTDILYVRIPVSVENNNYKIIGYPTFINNPGIKNDESQRKLPGESLKENKEKDEIENLVKSFINGYYNGNKTELSYFLKNKNPTNYLNGEYKVKDISKIDITKKDETYYVVATYQVSYNESLFDNGMEFKIIKEQDKLFVEEYNSVIN